MISRSEIIPGASYQNYIDLVKEDDILSAIEKNGRQFRKVLAAIPRKKHDYAYAEGKWTVREMVQHVIDCERVFAYRALRFSRMDSTSLPGFDEQQWGAHSGGSGRRWKDLLEEFKAVRASTIYLYHSLSDEQLRFTGQANEAPQNAFTIGFIIPGHLVHHIRMLKERYL
jgi:hypothetical protein